MAIPKNIYLVGPMGVGKSTIGRELAKQLGKCFFDSDLEIERRTGASIPLIFEIEREEGFRKRETQELSVLTKQCDVVLATGGGVVLRDENRRLLSSNGLVIYLLSTPEILYQRISRDKNRPLLQTENPLEKLCELVTQRDPLYRGLADMVIDTVHRTSQSTVREIVKMLQHRGS